MVISHTPSLSKYIDNKKNMDKGQSSKKTHKLPGPAGRVQAAMHKRKKGKQIVTKEEEEEVITTQECIARAMVEPEFDDSFTMPPWECVRSFGYLDMDCYSPIQTIVSHSRRFDYQRIPLVMLKFTSSVI